MKTLTSLALLIFIINYPMPYENFLLSMSFGLAFFIGSLIIECKDFCHIANLRRLKNQFKRLNAGDIAIIVLSVVLFGFIISLKATL